MTTKQANKKKEMPSGGQTNGDLFNNGDQADKSPNGNQSAETPNENQAPSNNDSSGALINLNEDTGVDYSRYEDSGHGDITDQDVTLNHLLLLQDMSPQTKIKDDKYIDGAEPGKIWATFNDRIFDSGQCLVIPCYKTRAYNTYEIQDNGENLIFQKEYPLDTRAYRFCEQQQFGKKIFWVNKLGQAVIDTAYIYVLVLDETVETQFYPAVIKFQKTKITAYKKWCELMKHKIRQRKDSRTGKIINERPHVFGCIYNIGSDSEKNDDGEWYYNFVFNFHDFVKNQNLLDLAYNFRESAKEGVKYKLDRNEYSDVDPFDNIADGSVDADDFDPFADNNAQPSNDNVASSGNTGQGGGSPSGGVF